MKRLECMDGLRGVLATYVMIGHMAPFALLPALAQTALSHGGAAVDVFFVLSGLVITQSLEAAGGRARPFLINRAARIFPVFLPVFALALVVQPLSCGFDRTPWIGPDSLARGICASGWPKDWALSILAHLTMTHGLIPDALVPNVWVGFLGAAWSLSTEWQFYMLALLLGGRVRRLCWVLLGLAAGGVLWRMAGPGAWQFSRAFLPNKAQFFALGVASVPIVRGEAEAWGRYLTVLCAALAVSGLHAPVGKMLPALVWTLCLAAQIWPWALTRVLRSAVARYLGAISYCLYLVNEPVQKLLGWGLTRLTEGDAAAFTAIWLPAAAILPVVAAGWLHRWLEQPALRWGHAMARQGGRKRVPAGPGEWGWGLLRRLRSPQ